MTIFQHCLLNQDSRTSLYLAINSNFSLTFFNFDAIPVQDGVLQGVEIGFQLQT